LISLSSFGAALSSACEWPYYINNMFVTKEKNTANIFGMQFHIRGKPWVVDIDDTFPYDASYDVDSGDMIPSELAYSKPKANS